MTFSTDKRNSALKTVVGGPVYKICMNCVFRCTYTILLWNWFKRFRNSKLFRND